jgi:hypothetical protein
MVASMARFLLCSADMSTYSPLRILVVACVLLVWSCGQDDPEMVGQQPTAQRYKPDPIQGYPDTGETCFHDFTHRHEAGFDEESSLGFSAKDALELFNANARGTLTWAGGGAAEISFQLETDVQSVEYDDFPRDEGYCVPAMRIRRFALTIEASDGRLAERLDSQDEEVMSIVAQSDGEGGIGLLFFSPRIRLAADSADHPSVQEAAAAHPEHDVRYIALSELSFGFQGRRARCLPGDLISDDPLEDCNGFDGVLLYVSHPSDVFDNIHSVDTSKIFERPLATWMWAR